MSQHIPGVVDAFAGGANAEGLGAPSPAGQLELILSNVRHRGHATAEELEWVAERGRAAGAFPTRQELIERKRAEREKAELPDRL